MKPATMTTMMLTMVVAVVMVVGVVEGRRRTRPQRGCRRAAGQGVMEEGEGGRYLWTMTGLDQDDLRVTYHVGAFAPEGDSVVFMYPRDRGQRALGLLPAKLFYDFSDPDNAAIAIRKARRGRGTCIVLAPDVSSYDEMQTQLMERNMTNRDVVEEGEAIRLRVEEVSDPSQFSQVLRDMCSQDLCGNPVDTVYYVTRQVEGEEDDEAVTEEAVAMGAMMEDRAVMLFNDRVVIRGFPTRRQWRRRMGPGGDMGSRMTARAQRRKERRQQRRQSRRERRRQWRRGGAQEE